MLVLIFAIAIVVVTAVKVEEIVGDSGVVVHHFSTYLTLLESQTELTAFFGHDFSPSIIHNKA